MPLFEYRCAKCKDVFEELVFGEPKEGVPCPKCGSAKTERLLSRCKFKMGGFGPGYADDTSPRVNPGGKSGCSTCTGGDCSSCG